MKLRLFKPNPWAILRGSIGLKGSVKARPPKQEAQFMRELLMLMDCYDVATVKVVRKA